ncbi:6617_t:CDS:2 [Paraglomus occultum]|uniref:6617_t:CDS:1 n=1 Tax=Paraglomus occultum TaxID=144539 RepID=A0A9N8Z1L3_9GLOM|nr:6617_t:CDS:2 [Paraglomus occultum]
MTSTSVRVALRIRPLSNKEIQQRCDPCITVIEGAPQVLIGTDRSFTYDFVFPSETQQDEVFDDCAKPLLDKLMEGYNATILAYGQTGSGKTYSMGTAIDGATIPPEHQGIVPRSIYSLFGELEAKKTKHPEFSYEVFVTFLELYNEDLIDLLNIQTHDNKKAKNELMIREDANGQIYWAGVKEVPVTSPEETLDQLRKGSLCRTVASTDMNQVSSRSHAIFSLVLKQTKIEDPEENKENEPEQTEPQKKRNSKKASAKITSKFHFVDLAGSERLKRTNAVGDRAKEGIAINGGLLALGNVISALGDASRKVTHVPYRDSKLTRLLQDSLGGNSQTLMLACVSPADSNFMETLNTLKYANRTRNIKNKVSVNESYGESSVEINRLRSQVSQLKMELQTLRAGGVDAEVARKYEEEINRLKGECGQLKMKMANTTQELNEIRAHRDTLLMEMDLNKNAGSMTEEEREAKIKSHPVVQQYIDQISELKAQVFDLQNAQVKPVQVAPAQPIHSQSSRKSSFAGNSSRDKGHIKFYEQENSRRHESSRHDNADLSAGHFPVEGEEARGQLETQAEHEPVRSFVKPAVLDKVKGLFSDLPPDTEDCDDDNEDLSADPQDDFEYTDSNGQKVTRRLRRRSVKDTLEKAKEQIRQGLLFIKNGGSVHDDPVLGQLVKTPSSTKSESYIDQMLAGKNEKRRSSSVSFSDIPTMDVPSWQESNPPPQQQTRRASNSSRSVSFSDQPASPHSTKSSQDSTGGSSQQNAIALKRMLHQIQADIAVKEELVAQLERAEQEFHYMRTAYEEKLVHMQECLIQLQREREIAVKRAANSGVSTRDKNSILTELKARYEHKMKKLIAEIGDLRRKCNEITQTHQTAKTQNETTMRNMRIQIEQLKAEKLRMVKRMKAEADRVREVTERTQREIQNLRRKAKSVQTEKKKLERQTESQRLMLEKRTKDMLKANSKLKSVTSLLKQTTTPKAIAKVFRQNRRKTSIDLEKDSPPGSRRTSDEIRAIEEEIYASGYDKKKLLDTAIFQFISGKQSLAMMDEMVKKRDDLVNEKQEALNERERIMAENCDEHGNLDPSSEAMAQDLEDNIDMINSEISYINAKLRSLQAETARNAKPESESRRNSEDVNQKAAQQTKGTTNTKERRRGSGGGKKKFSISQIQSATPEAAYDFAMTILRNLDSFETQAIVESFFNDIVKLRTTDWSAQMTLKDREKTITDLRKTLLAMRRAAVLTTVEYEKRNKVLEDEMRRGSLHSENRTPSPISPTTLELHMTDIENDAVNTMDFFDRIYKQVEAEVTSPGPITSENLHDAPIGKPSSRTSYFHDDSYFDSPTVYSPHSPRDLPSSKRNSFARAPLPPGWLKDPTKRKSSSGSGQSDSRRNSQQHDRIPDSRRGSQQLDRGYESARYTDEIEKKSSLGRSGLHWTDSMDTLHDKYAPDSPRTPGEKPRRDIRDRRGSLRDSHSRRNSVSSLGLYNDRAPDGMREHRDSGYYGSVDKKRMANMARRGSKDLSHMRQNSYGGAPDDDNVSVCSDRCVHTRSNTPDIPNVFDRLSQSHTLSSKYRDKRLQTPEPVYAT